MNSLSLLFAALDVFRKGKVVSNPEAWKHGQIAITALAPVLFACVEVARVAGISIVVTETQTAAIAGGIIAVVNIVCTLVSSDKIGVGAGTPVVDNPRELQSEDNSVVGSGASDIPTRASLGYERVGGPSSGDRAGG